MIPGIYASNQGIVGDRVGDFASTMLQIDPQGMGLLLNLSSGMAKEEANDTVVTWFEDVHQSMRSPITGAVTNVATTVPVADGSMFVRNMILLVDGTGEQLMVTAVAGNNLTVTRGMGGTTPTAMTSAMAVQEIGNAHPESSLLPPAIAHHGSVRTNVTQIFRNAWGVSGTAKAVKYRTGSKVATNKRQCAQFHAEGIERAAWFGRKHIAHVDGNPFRIADGVVAQIENYGGLITSANSGGVAGDISHGDWEEFLRKIFAKNIKGQPNERLVICGDIALRCLNQMARADGTQEIMVSQTAFGLNILETVTQFGRVKFLTHPLFVESPQWQKDVHVLHPGGIKKRVLRETFEENFDKDGTRTFGIDADQGGITSELCFTVGAAQTMGIYRNWNKGVATA